MTGIDFQRINEQMKFLAEADKLKRVLRRTSPIGIERRENSAEHSWQVALCALILKEYANEPIDVQRVIQMLVIHDLVEIDVDDTWHYNKAEKEGLALAEKKAAERIFAILPADQYEHYLSLWLEFETGETADSRFANSVDRCIAFLLNFNNQGGTWLSHQLSSERILKANAHIKDGSEALWNWVEGIVEQAQQLGFILDAA